MTSLPQYKATQSTFSLIKFYLHWADFLMQFLWLVANINLLGVPLLSGCGSCVKISNFLFIIRYSL